MRKDWKVDPEVEVEDIGGVEVDLEEGTVDTEDDLGLIGDLEVGIDINEDLEVEMVGIQEEEMTDILEVKMKNLLDPWIIDQ